MKDNAPPPLDYLRAGRHGPPQPPEPFGRQFLIGLGIGSGVSLVLWLLGWDALTSERGLSTGCALIGIVPLLKLSVGATMVARQTRKGVGAGLICSIGVGALILLGSCFAHMK